jgi:hypothetical protein
MNYLLLAIAGPIDDHNLILIEDNTVAQSCRNIAYSSEGSKNFAGKWSSVLLSTLNRIDDSDKAVTR